MNMNDEERAYAYTNFYQIDESLHEYLDMKGISRESKLANSTGDIISHKIEFLNIKNESRQLQRVFMQWIAGSTVLDKIDIGEYVKLMKQCKD